MRREKTCTISSHAAPSPARHLRTNSAPSLTAKALTAPTVSLQVPVGRKSSKAAKPLPGGDYDRYETKVLQSLPQRGTGRNRTSNRSYQSYKDLFLARGC